MNARKTLGIGGLLLFELILTSVLLSNGGFGRFAFVSLVAAACLVVALIAAWRGAAIPPAALWIYTAALLARAWFQLPAQDLATLAALLGVPIAAALLATGASMASDRLARVGLWVIAALRLYFAITYFQAGNTAIAVANVPAAIGAALWALANDPASAGEMLKSDGPIEST